MVDLDNVRTSGDLQDDLNLLERRLEIHGESLATVGGRGTI